MPLVDLLPEFYKGVTPVEKLQEAFDYWIDRLKADRDALLLQLNVHTAGWGLALWEQQLGLPTDATKSEEFRRTRILSKLRGAGTTTKDMVKAVAESFSNGLVDVIEHPPEEFAFDIKFVGTIGIPPNIDDLTAALNDIKPAHLAYVYVFIFMTWDEFDTYNKTWAVWDALNMPWADFEIYRE
jgi:hypothetical protein